MRTKIRSRLSLLIIALAAMIAIPAVVALADTLNINDLDTGSDVTKTPGGSGTAQFYLIANSSPNGDIRNCNVDADNPATVTVTSSDTSKATISGTGTVQLTACKDGSNLNEGTIGYSVPSNATSGTATISGTVSGGKDGALYNGDSFTVTVNAPTSSPAQNQAPTTPGTPALSENSSTPNQGLFGLEWTPSTDDGLPSGSSVTYALQHKDNDSAYSAVTGASSLSSPSHAFNTEDEGTWTYKVKASDGSLESDFSSDSASIKVDKSAPTLAACPSTTPTFLLKSGSGSQNVSLTADDPALVDGSTGSGVNTNASTLSGSIDTTSVGTKQVAFTAVDNVGNSTPRTCDYSVIFDWSGFFQPIDNKDSAGNYILNKAKAGSTVPVKFSLKGDQGLNIFAAGYPQVSAPFTCGTSSADLIEEYSTATNSGLKYDPVADQYIYNMKTDAKWAGSCRQLVVKLTDGTIHRANFNFFK